jgi:glycosyltransferase involved in cell wall biosynthesis
MRGGEKVVEALCRLLPDADIFTLFYDPAAVSDTIRSRRVTASFLNPCRRFHRALLGLMPMALESFDLRGYDLVISNESGPAKGILTRPETRHICYCHTPMRYLWHLYPEYRTEWAPLLQRFVMAPITSYLRLWDYAAAARVDEFVASSQNARRRIWRCYRRESSVIYPPVAVERFTWKPPEGYFLAVGELVPYKRLDYAVRSFSRAGLALRIAGDGTEYRRLKKMAGRSIEFCGRVSDAELIELYARCRALVMPGEEDFGMTAVEAVASGKPVIALGHGGVLESVPAEGAFFYSRPKEADLENAVRQFEIAEASIPHDRLRTSAARFSEEEFARAMREVIEVVQPR